MEPSPPEPVPEIPDVPSAPARPRRRVLRQALVVGLSVLALLCLGGGAAAFLFSDKATKPDLSTPALVTREYLSAYLVNRDDARAAEFQCGDGSGGLSDLRGLRDQIDAHHKSAGVDFAVSVDNVQEESRSGNTAIVAADLAIASTVQGQSGRELEHWQFTTRNDGGWRVCDGHEVT
jgi:hypothetical protein